MRQFIRRFSSSVRALRGLAGPAALLAALALPVGAARAADAASSVQPSSPPSHHPVLAGLDAAYPALDALYLDLHANPELPRQEVKTAAKLVARLRAIGFEVTEKVGGTGIVGVLRNGEGPTVLVRTDMDALPVKEETGAPYASTATAVSTRASGGAEGEVVPVMHACGHDVHMTAWVGAAMLLAESKDRWSGTLVFIGQPAEEIGAGAKEMIADGLFTRFPKPDFVLGIHVTNLIAAGTIGIIPGPASSASSAVDITFYGRGGHGATPHRTIDPILMASRAVVSMQGIVAREVNPLDTAVITVGTFHAGTKRNIIPEEAKLELTVRSYKPEVHALLLAAITRIAKAEAAVSGSPREPLVFIDEADGTEVVYNDPALAARLEGALQRAIGESNVSRMPPMTGSEDFGVYGRTLGVPSVQLRVGSVEPEVFAAATAAGRTALLPGPHSPAFLPDKERSIRTGVAAFAVSVMELMGK